MAKCIKCKGTGYRQIEDAPPRGDHAPGAWIGRCDACKGTGVVFSELSTVVPIIELNKPRRTDFAAEEAFVELTGHPPVYPQPPVPLMTATVGQRMGLITLLNFDSEETIKGIFDRIGVANERRTVYRTKSGSLRATGVLWHS